MGGMGLGGMSAPTGQVGGMGGMGAPPEVFMASLLDPTPSTNVDAYGDSSVNANTTVQNSQNDVLVCV
jgi:hypothetical protein